MSRLTRNLALALLLGLSAATARAQAPEQKGFFDVPPPEAPAAGDPLYGYVGTAFLAAGTMFVLCKSARR